ncbi:MAG: PfkB family carbohydrate kinase [Gemmobacter sp.]
MTPFDLIAVGDNCIDRFEGAVKAERIGGNAVNVAAQAARLGLRSAYVGAVGPEGEPEGDAVIAALTRAGVATALVERRPLPTSVTRLHVAADGDRQILHEDFGACANWTPAPWVRETLSAARHVHIGWLQDGGTLRRALALQAVPISQDVTVNAAPEDLGVEGLTIAFASLPEAEADEAEARARALLAQGAQNAVVTLGRRGSLALIGGQVHRAHALPVDPVDTTGAGDAYIAGFLAARLRGLSVPDAMAAGHANAARACGHPGGFPQ